MTFRTGGRSAPDAAQPAIDLRGVTVRYGDTTALDDVDLNIRCVNAGRLGSRGSGRRWRHTRRAWASAALLAVVGSVLASGVGSRQVLNPAGPTVLGRFASAAGRPDLSPAFLEVVAGAALTTMGYAVLGTVLAVVIGVVGGVLTSQTWWRRDVHARARILPGAWLPARVLAAVPRGLHEAVWALILLRILGRDPLVAVLAIGIPFGAITAKVVAELIDDAGQQIYAGLRAAGQGAWPPSPTRCCPRSPATS